MSNWKIIPLESIQLPSFDIKDMEAHHFNILKSSILRYGQTRTMQVRELAEEQYEVIEGRNILKAMKSVGLKTAVCYNHGKVEDHKCVKIYLDCELVSGDTNYLYLSSLVKKLTDNYSLAQLEGLYSLKELTELLKLCDYDWAKYLEEQKRAETIGLFGAEEPVEETQP